MKKLSFLSSAVAVIAILSMSFSQNKSSSSSVAMVTDADVKCEWAEDKTCNVVVEIETESGETSEIELPIRNQKKKDPK